MGGLKRGTLRFGWARFVTVRLGLIRRVSTGLGMVMDIWELTETRSKIGVVSMEKFVTTLFTMFGACMGLFLIYGLAVDQYTPAPKYAHVYVDDVKGAYHSQFHIEEDRATWNVRRMILGEAEQLGYQVDYRCENDFVASDGVVFWQWAEDAGLYEAEHRWNLDGSWNH